MKTWIKVVVGAGSIGIIALLMVYFFIYNKPHTNYETAKADYTLSVTELYNAYTEDKARADSLYTGKIVLIDGALGKTEISDSVGVAVFVYNQGMFGDEGVRCTMLRKFLPIIALSKEGEQLKIKGFCSGYNDTDVILEHCSLIN